MPAYLDKKTKKWFFQVSVTKNKKTKLYKKRGFRRKSEALDAEREFISKLNDMIDDSLSFNILYNRYLNLKKSEYKETTFSRFQNRFNHHIKHFFDENLNIKDLDLSKVLAWRNYIYDLNISTDFKNKLISDFKKFYTFLLPFGADNKLLYYLKSIKSDNIKKKVDFWTEDEFNKFLKVIINEDHRILFQTLYFTGLRIGELQALTWMDFSNNSLNISKTLTNKVKGKILITSPKTLRSERIILLPTFLSNHLLEYKERMIKAYGAYFKNDFFIFGGDCCLSHTTITRWKNNYCRKAKVKQIRLHDFRHSHASYLINNGADYMIVAERLGHSDVAETLNTYSHLFPNRQSAIIDIINKKH